MIKLIRLILEYKFSKLTKKKPTTSTKMEAFYDNVDKIGNFISGLGEEIVVFASPPKKDP
jgi:hypothetical protein